MIETSWRHLPALDGIRGVAILLVVVGHVGFKHTDFGGPIGVTLFFVLSGYLITSLLLAEHERSGRIDLIAFYARRGLRLLPALAVFMVIAPLVVWAVRDPGLHSQMLQMLPFTAIYSMNAIQAIGANMVLLSHMWSLSLEEQFYLVWPSLLIAILVATRSRPQLRVAVIGGLAALAVVWHIQGTVRYEYVRAYFAPDTSAFALLCGALLALAPPRWSPGRWWVLAGIAALLGLSAVPRGDLWGGDVLLWLMIPAVLVAALLIQSGPSASVLSWRPLVWFGDISYGLYLWHFTLMQLRPHSHIMHIPQRALMAVIAVAAAVVSRYVIEIPALRLKARFAKVPEPEVSEQAPAPTRRTRTVVRAVGAVALVLPAIGIVMRVVFPDTLPSDVRKFQQIKSAIEQQQKH